ncbi:MAG: hypothetical protein IT581_08460 [Verrucomicrobiales bacterium]|nr:hypothetical protein [Verrucomicrobiales bacterium]
MKRTTFVLEEGIMEDLRREARRRACDMSELVNEFLRAGLHRQRRNPEPTTALPRFDMGRPRANLADRDALENLMSPS